MGADVKAANLNGYLDETPIAEFLDNQMTGDNPLVIDYSFVTVSMSDFQSSTGYGYGMEL